jgi:hypothetical protein
MKSLRGRKCWRYVAGMQTPFKSGFNCIRIQLCMQQQSSCGAVDQANPRALLPRPSTPVCHVPPGRCVQASMDRPTGPASRLGRLLLSRTIPSEDNFV